MVMDVKKNEGLDEYIKVVETNKHDITLSLRRLVLDPVYRMYRSGTDLYFRERGAEHERIKSRAEEIMGFFEKKWYNPANSEQQKEDSIKDNLNRVTTNIIPCIKEIVEFYKSCHPQKHYFTDDNTGEEAMKLFGNSVNLCEKLCDRLKNLYPDNKESNTEIAMCNLLELLQKGLDDIDAEVRYVDEWENSEILIRTDENEFLDHVLCNIKDNIERHGFGTQEFRNKYVWEKNVDVKIDDDGDFWSVFISNNGATFTGDTTKVFDYGYFHGTMRHSGIGMNSIKNTMKRLGGDVEFGKSVNSSFSTTYKLLIRK